VLVGEVALINILASNFLGASQKINKTILMLLVLLLMIDIY